MLVWRDRQIIESFSGRVVFHPSPNTPSRACTSSSKKGESVTHVSGTFCHLCLRSLSGFKDLKEFTPPAETAIKQVLAYYSQAIGKSAQARREGWSHVLGYRKNPKDGLDRG